MTQTKADEFEDITRPECIDPYIVGDWCIDHRALIARALRRDEAIETALRDNELRCRICGEFFSGDPPSAVCRFARDGKHDVLVLLRREYVPA